MTLREGLVAARSHIVFVLGLLVAFAIIATIEKPDLAASAPADRGESVIAGIEPQALAPRAPLSEEQMEWARTAWQFFENNTDPATGLANSTDSYPSSTLWDTGSFLEGLISAYRLELIDKAEFDQRLTRALSSLARLELFDDTLPNKAFNVSTLKMSNYDNSPEPRGIGWSALDLARFLVPLTYIRLRLPEHAAEAEAAIARWRLSAALRDGSLIGTAVDGDGRTTYHQEGRLGYEQYAAKAMMLMGLDALNSLDLLRFARFETVEGHEIAVDTRDPGETDTPSFATSEPYLLDGLEFGFDSNSLALASNLYRAQEARFASTGKLTAVTEGHIQGPPFFAYATVWGGAPWAVISADGTRYDDRRTLSTKAAFAWNALFGTEYTMRLVRAVAGLSDPEKGWMEGRFESTNEPNSVFTANTNGIILASLAFQALGPMLRQE